MLERSIDLWDPAYRWRAITTNGICKADGSLVMGRGVALAAAQRFPELPQVLGRAVQVVGNVPHVLPWWGLVSFPTKYDWRYRADLELIRKSAELIRTLWDRFHYEPVLIPRPGCASGWLTWEKVRPVLEPIFDDDRFILLVPPSVAER